MKWTLYKFKKEIKKMKPKKRSEVYKKIPYLYIWTKNNKKEKEVEAFLNKVCLSEFDARSQSKKKYTEKEILNQFKKFSTRQELFHSKKGSALISAANRFKIYGKAIRHFKKIERSTSIGEETVRLFLEKIFTKKFIKIRHPLIKNPKTNYSLELDGFCEKLNIAFEYGNHLESRREHLKEIKYRDKIKKEQCEKLNIKLIQVKVVFLNFKDYEMKLKKELLKEFKRLNIKIPKKFMKTKVKIVAENIPFSKKQIFKSLKKYENKTQFKIKNQKMFIAARNLGILKEVNVFFEKKKEKMKKTVGFWYKNKNIIMAAKKCKTRTEFHNRYNVAYSMAKKNGIFEKACSHMVKNRLPYYWTPSLIIKKAKEYDFLNKFRKENSGAVQAADRFKMYYKVKKIFKK